MSLDKALSILPNTPTSTLLIQELKQDQYKQSLGLTITDLLGYQEVNPKTHGNIIKVLESSTNRKMIVIPRGCFKSTIGSISYPIWRLLRNPNERIMIDSELFTNSSRFLREIKGHLTNPKMTSLFGEFKGKDTWTDSEIVIKQRTKVYKEASITCSGIGAQKTSQHYDCIIADDMNSSDNSGTNDAREKVIQHYRYYISLLEPNGTIVVIATRYAANDLVGHILTNEIGV